MSEKQSNEQVEAFLNKKESQWQEEYKYLRALIFNETELDKCINGGILLLHVE